MLSLSPASIHLPCGGWIPGRTSVKRDTWPAPRRVGSRVSGGVSMPIFLVSPASRFISGQLIPVDGGRASVRRAANGGGCPVPSARIRRSREAGSADLVGSADPASRFDETTSGSIPSGAVHPDGSEADHAAVSLGPDNRLTAVGDPPTVGDSSQCVGIAAGHDVVLLVLHVLRLEIASARRVRALRGDDDTSDQVLARVQALEGVRADPLPIASGPTTRPI